MMTTKATKLSQLEQHLSNVCRTSKADRLRETIAELVRIPSENTPPSGSESACQRYISKRLGQLNLASELYTPDEVVDLAKHPAYWPDRDYTDRPNLISLWQGTAGGGGGRSLLLSGHIDTVPRGTQGWTRDPFGAQIEGNRLYGLGSNDMKGGIAAALVALEMLIQAGVKLRSDLTFETIVDEEFGGVNGTLAARLRGHNADAAIICEPSQLAICPAHTGGRTVHVTLEADSGGILGGAAGNQVRVTDQLHYLLGEIKSFAERRRQRAQPHALYASNSDPVPVWVTKVACGGWGYLEPITLPVKCKIEIYWQAMPGETKENVDGEFHRWLAEAVERRADLFPIKPDVMFPIRWIPGSAIEGDQALVSTLGESFANVTQTPPRVEGIAGACDMFVFHQHFDTPTVLFGPCGGNTHAPDEWVDLDSALVAAETIARFICRWCGVDWESSTLVA